MLEGIPWPKKHGQDEIWFHHPQFSLPESAHYLQEAFIKKYQTHGPSVLNMAMTAVKGYLRVKEEIAKREKNSEVWDPKTLKYVHSKHPVRDSFMKLRLECMRQNALRFRPMLSSSLKYSPNAQATEKCRRVIGLYKKAFGPMTISERMKSLAVRMYAVLENRRMKREGVIMRQPPTNRVTYPDRSFAKSSKVSIRSKSKIAKIA